MNKELEAWEQIKLGYICGQGAINEFALRESERENFKIIETTLKSLKDLEEELGIDLITLFKALKNKIEILDNGPSYTELCDFVYVQNGGSYLFCPISEYKVFVKDYNKTWTLTKEKLEDLKMNKELDSLERIENFQVVTDSEKDEVSTIKELLPNSCKTLETAIKRIPELEKEIEDTHKAYSMAVEKHIKDENEYIKWVQEGGYDKKKLQALEIIKEKQVNVKAFIMCCNLKSGGILFYNSLVFENQQLTLEEFNSVKEILL